MGSYHSKPLRPRRHVLVLFPERSRGAHLVEGVGDSPANHPVCHRPWLRLFRIIHIFYIQLLALDAQLGQLRRQGIRCLLWHHCSQLISRPLHFLLLCNLCKQGEEVRCAKVDTPGFKGISFGIWSVRPGPGLCCYQRRFDSVSEGQELSDEPNCDYDKKRIVRMKGNYCINGKA